MTDDEKAALADVYERAAGHLERHGWKQGTFGSMGGPRCMAGSIMEGARYDNTQYEQGLKFMMNALEIPYDVNLVWPVGNWNDDPSRTKDEVINTLHALANKLR